MSTQLRFISKNGLDNSSKTIINVADPVGAQDAATKNFSANATNLASGTVPAAVMPAHTGDVTSSAGSLALTLATVTQSTGSTFAKITLDTKGRITGNTAVAQADITGLLGAGSITNTMLANSAVANLSGTNTGDETLATIKSKLGVTTLSGSNTGDQTITLTGDVTGTGTGSFAATLANTTVTAAAYGSATTSPTFTVDGKGRLTAASAVTITPAFSSLTGVPTTLAGHSITDAAPLSHTTDTTVHLTSAQNTWIDAITATAAEVNYLSGVTSAVQTQLSAKLPLAGGSMTGSIVIPTGQKITLTDLPTIGTDAANKNYVDSNITGLSWKNSVKLATTANIDLTTGGLLTIDGIVTVAGNRVLVKDQTTTSQNGIYVVAAGAWTRTTDMDAATETSGAAVFVEQGTANADTGWTQINAITTLGTDAVSFVQFNGAAGITAGVGLLKTGNVLDINMGAGIAQLPSDEVGIDVYATGGLFLTIDGTASSTLTAAQLSLTKVGTAGTYKSVTTDAYGRITAGTNPTTLAGYGITDAAPLAGYNTHIADTALHLTSAQNTWIDAITATAAEVNYLSGVTSAIQTQFTGKQAASAELTGLAGIAATVGLVKKTAAGTYVLDTNTYLTSNQTITLTGGVTGSGTGSFATTVVTNANMTGAVTSVGNATSLGSFTSANLAGALTDETGSGSAVFATSPTLVTPLLGTPTSGVLTNCTGTAAGLTAGTVTTNANLTGEVTSVGNATTVTNAAVIGKVITGYASGAGTVAATDTIVQAINKLNGNISSAAPLASPTFTGTATAPTFATANSITTSASLTTSATTALQVAASISAVAYRSASFLIQAVSGTSYHSTQLNVIHDGTNTFIQENFTMFTGSSLLTTVDANIAGGALQLLITPVNAVTTIKTAITAISV